MTPHPPETEPPRPAPRNARPRSWVIRSAVALGVLYLVYLLLANLFLTTPLAESVNRRPERQRVTWDSGWSWIPGRFAVSGLRFERHARAGDLVVEVGEVSGRLELWPLTERRLRLTDLRGEGLSLDWRKAADPEGRDLAPVTPRRKRRALAIELDDIVIEGIEHVLIQGLPHSAAETSTPGPVPEIESGILPPGLDGLRLEGDGGLHGSVVVDRDRKLWLDATLHFGSGRLFDGRGHEATVASFESRLAFNGWHPRSERGAAAMQRVAATLDLEAGPADVGLLSPFLGRSHGVALGGRGDRLAANLQITAGRLTPGSQLLVTSPGVEVRFLDYLAEGVGHIEGRVVDDGTGLEVTCSLGEYQLWRSGLDEPHLRGVGFVVRAYHPSTSLDAVMPAGSEVQVSWPPAELPDLTIYNAFLPAERGVQVLSGQGEVEAEFRLATEGGEGWVRLDGRDVRLRVDTLELAGALEVDTRFEHLDWEAGALPIGGSRIALKDVSVTDLSGTSRRAPRDRGWWAQVGVVEGTLGRDLRFVGALEAKLRDTGPLVALFQRHRLPGFVEDLLRIDDVQAQVQVESSRDTLALEPFVVEGDRLEVRGRFRLAEQRSGLVYLRYRGVAAAAWVEGDDFEVQLYRPRRWFERLQDGGAPVRNPTPSTP